MIKQVEDKEGDLFKRTHLQFLSVKLKGSVWHNQSTDSGISFSALRLEPITAASIEVIQRKILFATKIDDG